MREILGKAKTVRELLKGVKPHFMAWSTVLVEILGGLAVMLGAFVTLAGSVATLEA